jgi:peptidoglycan pentaglycine glycine transferase (the first glycine)
MQSSFLQTQEWAEFQNALGRRTFFISGRKKDWQALLIRHELPLGKSYLYCPRGPEFDAPMNLRATGIWAGNNESRKKCVKEFLDAAAELATNEKCVFLRWDPSLLDKELNFQDLSSSDFDIRRIKSVQPQRNAVVGLLKTETELLAGMHEKTRYNIRLAERKNVVIAERGGKEALDDFWKLLSETSARDRFSTHPHAHYQKMTECFRENAANKPETYARIFFAEYESRPLAAAMVMYCGKTATYLHGASSSEHREFMAPHLLHWKVALAAKNEGYAEYDLGGIDEKNPHWSGITRFKRGFGVFDRVFEDSIDIIYKPFWYTAYRIAQRFM